MSLKITLLILQRHLPVYSKLTGSTLVRKVGGITVLVKFKWKHSDLCTNCIKFLRPIADIFHKLKFTMRFFPVTCLALTHLPLVLYIYASTNWINIGSDNGLLPGRRQSIIWTNAALLSIEPLGTIFSEILIEIHTFSFKRMHLKMSSGKWRPFCLCKPS